MRLHVLLPVILIPAKLLEEFMRHFGLPGMIGPIIVGIGLGPSFLEILPSDKSISGPSGYFIELAHIGLCALLFKIGLETRFSDFVKFWREAFCVALTGMFLPLLLGSLAGYLLGWSFPASLLLGAVLTATSIGVTASVLSELNAAQSKVGTLVLGAAIIDDILAMILLAALIPLATSDTFMPLQILKAVLQATGFITGGFIIGPWISKVIFWVFNRTKKGSTILLVLAFCYFLLLADIAEAAGLDMIIGAYTAGVAFSSHQERSKIENDLDPLIEILTPLFFVILGASMDLSGLNPLTFTGIMNLGIASLIMILACAGKFFSGILIRGNSWTKLAVGSGMMPRGEVGFVFAQMGMKWGVFSSEIFSILVTVLIATTIIGPILLRYYWLKSSKPTDQL